MGTKQWKGIYCVSLGDATYPVTNIYGGTIDAATGFSYAGIAGTTDPIPSTFNNIYVNGGIITSWD